MVTVDDIFHKIAQDLKGYSGKDKMAEIEEFMGGCVFDLHLAITTDMEETELDFLGRYGHGHTFYFRLQNYDHGRKLAGEIFWVMQGQKPDMSQYTGSRFSIDDKIFLFVHVRNVTPERPSTAQA